MIRNWIKAGAARVLAHTGMDHFAGSLSGLGNFPVVIGYHRVVEDFASNAQTSIPSLLVSRQNGNAMKEKTVTCRFQN